MAKVTIYNGDCLKAIARIPDGSIDCVLTSPPYNISRTSEKSGATLLTQRSKCYPMLKYDMMIDAMTSEEYTDWQCRIFTELDRVLKPNGCVLYNISYGAENTTGCFDAVHGIYTRTPFTIADKLVWMKGSALPNNTSPNRVTRICEDVFVFCRKTETGTFHMNKRETGRSPTGQSYYENVFNVIDARNNDAPCDLNKATFSTEFARKLLALYAKRKDDAPVTVLDPFMGTGTTASAARDLEMDSVGAEISPAQCEYARNRLADMFTEIEIVKIGD